MASPIKSSVDLTPPAIRVSRIRRDPPPKEKKITAGEVKEREAWSLGLGIAIFAAALFVIAIFFTNAAGWSPSQYTWHINQTGG